jgi:hypothetical protein
MSGQQSWQAPDGRWYTTGQEELEKESRLVAFREWMTTGTGIAALIVAIIGLLLGSAAAGGKLFSPSTKPTHIVTPSPHSSTSFPATPPVSSLPPDPAPSEAATFLSATSLGLSACGCYYQYSIDINFFGLQGQSPVLYWWTVYSASGLDAGTSGSVTDYSLPYNNDTWTTTINVKEPVGAADYGWQWYTEFAVYAPDGTELAEHS